MKIVNKFLTIGGACLIALFSSAVSYGQTGNMYENFSPYTMYGLGMMNNGASVSKKILGGVGIASGGFGELNYLNPASLGNIRQRSALFNFGIEAQNFYSTTKSTNAFGEEFNAKSVGNIISLNDLGFGIPLARGIGFSVALTPVSSVGYNSTIVGQENDIINNIGRVYYSYKGEGGISAVTGSVGVRLFKGFNLGASLIYYFGSIDRYYGAELAPMLEPINYSSVKTMETTNISRVGGAFGAQYRFRVSKTGHFTLGLTYQLKTTMNSDVTKFSYSQNSVTGIVDTIRNINGKERIVMPQKYGAGLAFVSDKFEVEANYTSQDWSGAYDTRFEETGVTLGKQVDYRLGVGYTPNRGDIRNAFNRWTYKIGGHYGQNYLIRNGVNSSQFAVTIGADVPLKINSPTRLNFGFEYGQRGTINNNAVKESYFKVMVGFSFFGDDMWFEKRKFN